MNEVLLELTLAYVFLTAIILLSLVYSRILWLLKCVLIIVALVFYWLSYQGWKETQGWPSETELPDRFLLHAAVIEEPEEVEGKDGYIYMWLTNIEKHQLASEPRSFKLDYDSGIHGKLEIALREMKNGNLQLGEINSSAELKESAKKQKRAGHKYLGLEFVKLPDPALPEK